VDRERYMISFYDRMYTTKNRPNLTLEDLPKIKQEFQSRKIDQKFLAEDFSVASLSISSLGDPNKLKASSSSAPGFGASAPVSSVSKAAPAPPPPAVAAAVAPISETVKYQGRVEIIPTQPAAPIKKPLSPEVVAAPPPPPPPKSQEKTATALYDYVPDGDGVSISRGEIVTVVDSTDPNWWLVRNSNGKDGWAPATFLQAN
jgi:hypothetical protein